MQIERMKLDQLTEDPNNARVHDDRNMEAIKGSLRKFGQQKPIVVTKKGIVIAGNATFRAAKLLGWTEVSVVRTDLEDVLATLYALADNKTSELGGWEEEQLGDLMRAFHQDDLKAIGFETDEILKYLGEVVIGGQTDPDEIPAPPSEAITKIGDVWVLGDHRLTCGDAGDLATYERLLQAPATKWKGKPPVHLVNTDPPYNVNAQSRTQEAVMAGMSSFEYYNPPKEQRKGRKITAKMRPLENDDLSEADYADRLDVWFGLMAQVIEPGRSFYVWGGYSNCASYAAALRKAGFYFSQAIIWVKNSPMWNRKDFLANHEWAFYGWREGAGHSWFGPNNIPDVWDQKKVGNKERLHLTEKPVDLAVRAVQYSSRPGETVLDPFGGAGGTLIACQQTGRRARLIELDPIYCDVIVKRFEDFTGEKARHVVSDPSREKIGVDDEGLAKEAP